jgi:hypothetical protein
MRALPIPLLAVLRRLAAWRAADGEYFFLACATMLQSTANTLPGLLSLPGKNTRNTNSFFPAKIRRNTEQKDRYPIEVSAAHDVFRDSSGV